VDSQDGTAKKMTVSGGFLKESCWSSQQSLLSDDLIAAHSLCGALADAQY
jgi:hypothetical protein